MKHYIFGRNGESRTRLVIAKFNYTVFIEMRKNNEISRIGT